MTSTSEFVAKEPCPACGSRDNLARYSDGHAHCFGCGHRERGDDDTPKPTKQGTTKPVADLIQGGDFRELRQRGLTEETCRKFGYRVTKLANGSVVQVAPYYDKNGSLVSQKVRGANKDFHVRGNHKDAVLFGQHLWSSGGRRVVITEGELDTMSVSQMQGHKWPVVSLPSGAQSAKAAITKALPWLSQFAEVVLMFDMDEAGREAMAECAPLFQPGQCRLAELPRKDASDMLMAGEGDQVVQAIWQAKVFRPDGIVTLSDIREALMKPVEWGLPWFCDTLTKLTYGRRFGEIYAFGAGTGIGKTDFLTQQIVHDIVALNQPVGLFMLEQQPVETGRRVAGKLAGKRFHIPDAGWTTEELVEAIDKLEGSGKLFLYDNFGATEWDVIASTIRFLVHAEGVRIFYLDHLTALAAAEENEREGLERIMAEVGSLVKELNIIVHLVSHLATPEGKPHEEGGRVMIRHFKGSRSIGFWCAFMFGLERDQQHPDERWRTITIFRVLKDRYTGQSTGKTIPFDYDTDQGRLYETELPEDTNEHGFRDESGAAPF